MNKKGQAAMEFLMTYGWAILAAIIAIAVLAYFGVFNPGRYTSEMCQVSAPFTCDDNSVASATPAYGVRIILRNGGDVDYNVEEITIANCGIATFATPVTVNSGATSALGALDVPCAPALTQNAAFRGNIEISYRDIAGGVDARLLTATGSITRKKVIA
jgi:uncharacterized protein (UPF0333 family)